MPKNVIVPIVKPTRAITILLFSDRPTIKASRRELIGTNSHHPNELLMSMSGTDGANINKTGPIHHFSSLNHIQIALQKPYVAGESASSN